MGSQRVRQDWATFPSYSFKYKIYLSYGFIYIFTHIYHLFLGASFLFRSPQSIDRVLDYSVRFSLVIYFIHSSVYMSGASLGAQLQCRRPGFDPWVEKMPWRRAQQPTPVLSPGESHGQRSCRPQGRTVRHNWATRQPFLNVDPNLPVHPALPSHLHN